MVALTFSHFGVFKTPSSVVRAPQLPDPTRKSKIRCVLFSLETGYRRAQSRDADEVAVYSHGQFPQRE